MKVNGPRHENNPLLRPTGIQIATKSNATLLQAMAPTNNNVKTVRQTSLLHIESNLDRLGLLSPTHDQRSQQQSGQITLQSVLINNSKFLKATHRTEKEGQYNLTCLTRPHSSEAQTRITIIYFSFPLLS